MKDIEYIVKRLEEIYFGCCDEVYTRIEEHEKTYRLIVILKGVNDRRGDFEIDKRIENVGEVINYICKEIERIEYENTN